MEGNDSPSSFLSDKSAKIFIASHRGLVGSAIYRRLKTLGFTDLIVASHSVLDLTRQSDIESFFLLVRLTNASFGFRAEVAVYICALDVWQGTQLLAIDVAVATGLLKRALTRDELTEKEKKALRRTLTDMALVVPIGILMLLTEKEFSRRRKRRLDLLRQLEKVKEMEIADNGCDEMTEAIISSSSNNPQ
ncbi:uncharacterized protein A4U43_C10F3160 [Asparagus officinalis]|uniref:Uncharacterized protein n=1 Tax=Asparagus officinalis TaxID=4686 RepID=A0A5P1E3I4_ASPOF|nr:uncharacterized protein A4U43_C10F3160 [Asparagus officinalis]